MKEDKQDPKVETITPQRALRLLEKNERNRNVSFYLRDLYSTAMADGRWKLNGETIKIGRHGELLDGQHRLHGCIRSGVSFKTYVVYGINPDTFDTIDVGRKRLAGDILSIEGCNNANAVAGAYRWINSMDRGLPDPGSRPVLAADEIRSRWVADPSVETSVRIGKTARKTIAPGLAGALHWFFSKRDKEMADNFFHDLASGAGMTEHDPVFVLREWLLDQKTKRTKSGVTRGEIAAKAIRAWNHRRAGRKTKQLKGLVARADGSYRLPMIE